MMLSLPSSQAAGTWLRSHLAGGAQLSADSRQIQAGDGFLAYPGLTADGRDFIGQACERGACAVLMDAHGVSVSDTTVSHPRVPLACLEALRHKAGEVSAQYYDHPSQAMTMFAVTGTNGKTSCAQWLAAGVAGDGARAAALGTLGLTEYPLADPSTRSSRVDTGSAEIIIGPVLTTPDAVSLQRVLASLAANKVAAVALEASSIGLHQRRLAATRIDVAIYTNMSRDHLDYHRDMTAYRQAKQQLFRWPGLKAAVVNGDDEQATNMLGACAATVATYAYGFEPERYGASAHARLRITALTPTPAGMHMELDGDLGRATVQLPLIGRFNALNAAAVCLGWHAAGVPFDAAAARLEHLRPVPGRMQVVQQAGAPLVVVDYAHTPQALEVVLNALAPVAQSRSGKLWVVFGCGGDRDAGKRALMGGVADQLADFVALTSDNPRSEEPQVIIDQIASGMSRTATLTEPDRGRAIELALQMACASDVVLVAGKGHESYQEIGARRIDFSDIHVVQTSLAGLDPSGRSH